VIGDRKRQYFIGLFLVEEEAPVGKIKLYSKEFGLQIVDMDTYDKSVLVNKLHLKRHSLDFSLQHEAVRSFARYCKVNRLDVHLYERDDTSFKIVRWEQVKKVA
jgi:hypothetical protein